MAIDETKPNQPNSGCGPNKNPRSSRPGKRNEDALNLSEDLLGNTKTSKVFLDILKKIDSQSKSITVNIKELATKGLPQSSKVAKLLNTSFDKIYKTQARSLKTGFINTTQFELLFY